MTHTHARVDGGTKAQCIKLFDVHRVNDGSCSVVFALPSKPRLTELRPVLVNNVS